MGEIIAIVSGKGGVGKTTLCANVARALAMRDKKVICIDCDTGLNNLDMTLGLEQKTVFDLSDVLEDRCPLHKAVVTHFDHWGLSMISAAADFTGKTVLLVDDIFTTGTTCGECAKELYRAGAKTVHVFALSAAGLK